MIGRKSIVGLAVLCALVLSALAAQGATAEITKGTTAFTCVKGATPKDFVTEHCKAGDAGTKEYGHVAFAQDTTTKTKYSSAKTDATTTGGTNTTFKEVIAGVELELVSSEVIGEGSLENKQDTRENAKKEIEHEHYISGTATLEYRNVKVAKPSGKGCEVFTDETATKTKGAKEVVDAHINATTTGQGDSIKFEPATAPTFASFFVECTTKVPAVEGTWEITGSVTCKPEGATINCSHKETTEQKTLKGKGNIAGYEGKITVTGTDPIPPDTVYTPLSVTTVETPNT